MEQFTNLPELGRTKQKLPYYFDRDRLYFNRVSDGLTYATSVTLHLNGYNFAESTSIEAICLSVIIN